ncbi:MAG: Dipeptidase [Syntrophorhabdus sp. PtaU1.Bin058]|nr:MAG: Dipeptidase [Syntrophorhabdus sp. PtaU1.Bin058]
MKKTVSAIILTIVFLASTIVPSSACTTIIVGSKATKDGSIIIARNEDGDGPTEAQNMVYHRARTESEVFRSNSISNPNDNTFTYTMPKGALAYVSFPRWSTGVKSNYSFEETGINEYGVAISATETIFNSEQVLKIDPYLVKTGVTEDSVTSVVLPYATSAREGARILGKIIEKTGAGEGFGVAFSDGNEAWYLETASGHHWLAMRIPDDSYFVSANQGRFQQADFSDTMNVMSSPGLLDFAVSNRLFDPQGEPFNFFKCFVADIPHDGTYNYPRVKMLLRMYSEYDYDKNDGLYPVFMLPKEKMSVWDVAKGLRNRYNGTPHDPYENRNPREPYRPISVLRTSLSHITQARPDLPEDIAHVQYIALGMTDLSAYVPFYKGITTIPREYQNAGGQADNDSMFWKYRKMQALVLQDYPRFAPQAHEAIARFEKEVTAGQEVMEAHYLKLYLKDRTAARRLIQNFTDATIARQNRMLAGLIMKISRALGMEQMTNEEYTVLIKKTEALYHFHGA